MYYETIQKHKRTIVTATLVLLAVIIGWIIVILIGRIGKLPVQVSVVPSSAEVTIDSRNLGSGTQWLTPGTYTITAKKDGFKQQKKTVVITNKKDKNVVSLSLEAESSEAKKWAEEHKDEYTKNEKQGAIEASMEGKYFTDNNPITTKLPFKDPYFTIGYVTKGNSSIVLTISTPSPRYRFYAVEKIREFGYDPTDFTIEFKDFKNPLEAE